MPYQSYNWASPFTSDCNAESNPWVICALLKKKLSVFFGWVSVLQCKQNPRICVCHMWADMLDESTVIYTYVLSSCEMKWLKVPIRHPLMWGIFRLDNEQFYFLTNSLNFFFFRFHTWVHYPIVAPFPPPHLTLLTIPNYIKCMASSPLFAV